ncbi:hypothetical protein Sa4125_21540 [Aureimonas sp. SA4125]|uniref:helix-turn-helix domain-containing protein n=1 Tax=Aureimonas sp. SA4125 TaxID=2826993 RepID=UPI001CC7FEDA|nr:helix-turn-helix transcriptional regulator [Aureimonas sp. SA4125]BDA84612.1 hypothetical protein Sa4125_21540 [Aureimonas sp. SA4125]
MSEVLFPEPVVTMISQGFTTTRAFRWHLGLPIQCLASRTGIEVARLLVIESGSSASEDEIEAIAKALELPHGVFRG